MKQPIKRSKLRLFLGKYYYFFKKQWYWHFSKNHFARQKKESSFTYEIFSHETVLLRKLKDIDMWMQHNKVKNLELAIQKLDGLVIEPGEVFSYWWQIGNPTKKKGYVEGMVLHDGRVQSGIGGGLCQLSNLLYWITLHTPLTIKERWRHSYDVFPDVKRKQPFGSGATCAYPSIDLQIENKTNTRYQLKVFLTETHLVGQWLANEPAIYTYKVFEKSHEIKSEWWGGYTRNNTIFREVLEKETGETWEEFVTENHAIMMYSPLLSQDKKE